METIFFAYLAIGFILAGWRLDIKEEERRKNEQKESGFFEELAIIFNWLFLWLPILIVKSIRKARLNANKEIEAWMAQARLI